MKQLLILSLLILSSPLIAQNDFVVISSGDTIYGKITFPISDNFVENISVKGRSGTRKIGANFIQHCRYKQDDYKSILHDGRYRIMKVIEPGYLSYLTFRPDGEYEFSTKFLYKITGEAMQVSSIGFRGFITNFLEECPQITQAVEDKKYGLKNLDELVAAYNSLCLREVRQDVISTNISLSELSELQSTLAQVLSRLENEEQIPDRLKESLKKFTDRDVNLALKELLDSLDK